MPTVAQLKRTLKGHGLATTGKKADLLARLAEFEAAAAVPAPAPEVAAAPPVPPPFPPYVSSMSARMSSDTAMRAPVSLRACTMPCVASL